MRLLNRISGLLVAAVGMLVAGFGPSVYEAAAGRPLPTPIAGDRDAMAVWSGVAFARAFGAVTFGIGAVLWAASAPAPRPRAIHGAFFLGFLFAALIVWSQQATIWTGPIGLALVVLFGALAAISGLRVLSGDQL